MPNFAYKAKDRSGKLIEGQMAAEGAPAVVARLQSMGLFPLSVGSAATVAEGTIELGGWQALKLKMFGLRISIEERANFLRQLADLIGAGIPLARSLTVVAEQTPNPQFRAVMQRVTRDVTGGDRLHRAMGRHRTLFRPLEVSMIHAGEEGGLLEEVLTRLADFTEREKELRDKIVASLTYPLIMVLAGVLVVAVLVTFVFPRIVNVYNNMNQEVPAITTALIQTSEFARSYYHVIAATLVVLAIAARNFVRTEEGKLLWHRFLLAIPKIGTIILEREVASFARTLGSLLQNGVTILTALEITEDVVGNEAIRRKVAELPDRVTRGEGVSTPLRRLNVFPPVVASMLAVGEESGHLDATLLRVAGSFERKVEQDVRKLTSMIEPAIMIVIAAVVAVIVIAMLLPLVGMDPSGGLD